ncbi:hypothetical protein CTAYLR_006823 [Chrysophaeum taylorii]|uniref:SET domain-containing protein n=1 Tax=Chrysophaeum taylorii TaxID=2483200 RepID=A0AAD7UBH5_9STRA|nr:hypothetical protein CTAYLR_006823 [Chrysophaeum taylorii]
MLLPLVVVVGFAGGLRVKDGSLDTLEPWVFVERFCFVPTPKNLDAHETSRKYGLLDFRVTFPVGASPEMLLYYDGFDKWVDLYTSDGTCSKKRREATRSLDLGTKGGFVRRVSTSDGETTASGKVKIDVSTNVWVFIAFSNCDAECSGFCQGPLVLDYDLHLTNGNDPQTREFSADETGALPTTLTFLGAYGVLGALCTLLRARLRRRRKFHHTVAMLCWSVWVQLAGCVFAAVHYATFAADGEGAPACRNTATFLWHAADLLLVLLVVLLAKGWTIVRRKLSINGRVRVAAYVTALTWTTLSLELWRFYVFDPAKTASHYESPPGVVLVSLRAAAVLWFWHAARTTARNYRSKIRFYRKFNAIFTLWLIAKPLLVLVGLAVDDNRRQIFILASDLALAFAAHASLAFLYLPNLRCNTAFPFHANSSADLGITNAFFLGAAAAEGDYNSPDVNRDEDAGIDIDTGRPIDNNLAPHAPEDIGPDEVAIRVPRELAMVEPEKARDHWAGRLAARVVASDKPLGLPAPPPTPARGDWPDDVLEALQDPRFEAEIDTVFFWRHEQLARHGEGLDPQCFLDALDLVCSRTIRLGSDLALVPLLDLANHDEGGGYYATDDGDICLVAGPRGVRRGEEITLDYGPRSNALWLLHYAFIPEPNKADATILPDTRRTVSWGQIPVDDASLQQECVACLAAAPTSLAADNDLLQRRDLDPRLRLAVQYRRARKMLLSAAAGLD